MWRMRAMMRRAVMVAVARLCDRRASAIEASIQSREASGHTDCLTMFEYDHLTHQHVS